MGPNEVDKSLLSTVGKDSDNPYDTAMPGGPLDPGPSNGLHTRPALEVRSSLYRWQFFYTYKAVAWECLQGAPAGSLEGAHRARRMLARWMSRR